jgi:hypothetical protein
MSLVLAIAVAAAVLGATAPSTHAAPATQHASPAPASPSSNACRRGYYENSYGACVHRPVHAVSAPAGATAKCRDGTYSFSQHASGTCSRHGGVAVWIRHP